MKSKNIPVDIRAKSIKEALNEIKEIGKEVESSQEEDPIDSLDELSIPPEPEAKKKPRKKRSKKKNDELQQKPE